MLNFKNRQLITKMLLSVLLLNLCTPAFAQLLAPENKILVCTADGFQWRSTDSREQHYFRLAKQLELDLDELGLSEPVAEKVQLTNFNSHGNCTLCFFEPTPVLTQSYQEVFLTVLNQHNYKHLDVATPPIQHNKFVRPPNKAPPKSIS